MAVSRYGWNHKALNVRVAIGGTMSSEQDNYSEYHDNIWPDPQGETLSQDNAQWLATQNQNIDSVVRIERIRKENPRVCLAVMAAVENEQYRGILTAIQSGGGAASYDVIEPYLSASRRTVRRRVSELAGKGVVDVEADMQPALVVFPSAAVEVLVEDALSMFFTTNTNTK